MVNRSAQAIVSGGKAIKAGDWPKVAAQVGALIRQMPGLPLDAPAGMTMGIIRQLGYATAPGFEKDVNIRERNQIKAEKADEKKQLKTAARAQ
jgi:hypothetical protein